MEKITLTMLGGCGWGRNLFILCCAVCFSSVSTARGVERAPELATMAVAGSHTKKENMTTAIECVEQMVDDYLRAELSIDQFTKKWQGPGGRRYQQNGLDFANINPCPQYFETGLLFVPVTGGYDGSLEFYLHPEAKLSLSDLVASYGARSQAVNVPKAELFKIARLDHSFNATLIARFERENPLPGDRPVQLIFQKEPR